ncbi:hypothetical protein [Prevotella pallens]|uniref:hypothetical protein n=1 Tax=Prevotella pallens TaxID=60133 RepID=UPI0028F14CAD|nr:hypothetical protein [Prevotella pallens]
MKFWILFLLLIPIDIFAESRDSLLLKDSMTFKTSPLEASLELSTKYVWRGIEYGTGAVTFAKISYQKRNFDAYLEGVYSTNGSHSEVDLGIGYTYKWLYIGLADYYYPSAVSNKDKYFNLANRNTGHYIEMYSILSPTKIPLQLTLSSYIFGADKNLNGGHAFSSYVELAYFYKFKDNNVLTLTLGSSLNKGFYTDYESGFNIVNVSIKYETNFTLGSFHLPVSASYIVNPYREKSYFTFSVFLKSKI